MRTSKSSFGPSEGRQKCSKISKFSRPGFFPKLSFQPNLASDYKKFRAPSDLIFSRHTHAYILSKLGEDAHSKRFIWPLKGASKLPQNIRIQPRMIAKVELFAKFSIKLYKIQGSQRLIFSKHTHIYVLSKS